MKMKRSLTALAFLLTACTATHNLNGSTRSQRNVQEAAAVQEKLASRHYTLNINNMYPMRTSGKYVGGEFFLEIKGDTLRSYLPYFGAVHRSSYNPGNALDFEHKIESYRQERLKKNRTSIYLTVRTSEDAFKYTISVFDDGRAQIYVQPLNRDYISYDGELKP